MPPSDDVERFLADGPPGEPLEERRVFAELHDALFGGETAPVTLSRYVVLERIAAGGLGVVYAGFDPQLDRKVAIKLLHSGPRGAPVAETHARLLREARTLAQLAHPNVVAVHDVGTYDEHEVASLAGVRDEGARGVFVVMELVVGLDLGRWLSAQARTWREILDVFIQAGEGLAAAHAAGIVHRDFKPANVLVGDDRRARVLDFGLARALAPPTPRPVEREPAKERSVELTHSGAVLGTPAYMAPEQHAGRASDERTDEFAFFAALYEAIYGQLPFPESDLDQLASDKERERIATPPRTRPCPPALHRAIVRGLSANPAERFASMNEALVELRRIQRGWRRRAPWLLAGGASLLAIAAVARSPDPDPCAAAAEPLDGIWDETVRANVQASLVATDVPFAASTVSSVERSLDAYVESLASARVETCRRSLVADAEPKLILDTNRCLDRRRARLRALTTLLQDADPGVAERAVDAAASLPGVSECLLATAEAEGMAEIEPRLAEAEALLDAGRFDDGLRVARRAIEASREHDDLASESRGLHVLGRLQAASGRPGDAEATLQDAWLSAERVGLTDAAARALVDLVGVVVQSSARYDEAERLAELARARLAFRAMRDELDARFALEVARLRLAQGRTDAAIDALAEGLELARTLWGEGHPRVADVLNERGNALDRKGRYPEAMEDYQRALAIRRQVLGPEHPRVGASLNNIGNIHASLGRQVQAQQSYERALAIYEDALGPQHPRVAAVINNLAIVHDQLGRTDDALREHRRALAIRERTLPDDHPLLALDHNNIGSVLAKLGRRDEALAEYERALEIRERRLGPEHPDVAFTLDNIAVTLGQLNRLDDAARQAQRGLQIRESAFEADHPDVATSLVTLAGLLQRQGKTDDARPLASRALSIRTAKLGAEHPSTAEASRLVDALSSRPRPAATAPSFPDRPPSSGEDPPKPPAP